MIGPCLSNKNESAIVLKTKNFSELNKARIFEHMHETLNIDKKTNCTVWL